MKVCDDDHKVGLDAVTLTLRLQAQHKQLQPTMHFAGTQTA